MFLKLERKLRAAVADLDRLNADANAPECATDAAVDRLDAARAAIEELPNSPGSLRLRALALVADGHVALECARNTASREDLSELAEIYWPERAAIIAGAAAEAREAPKAAIAA